MRCEEEEVVARALGLRTALPSNWRSGIASSASEGAFVTPAIAGWVLVVGRDLAAVALDTAVTEQRLCALSEQFEEAQWFATDASRDVHGWAVAKRGELQRAYAYSEEHGHVWWHGELLPAEHEAGCFLDDPRDQTDDEIKWWPDRAVVRRLAASWSLDPATLSAASAPPGVGLLGRI